MKFSLFVHMERLGPGRSHQQLFADLVELALMAEDGGMDAVWIGEHHAMEFTIGPNPLILLAYLGARTSRIRLGTSTLVAPFWHPLRLAGEIATADLATGGRLDIGISRGAYQFEFDRMVPGLRSTEGGRHLREMVPALKALWAGPYAHEGSVWRFPESICVPMPVQQPHPPIWIAARDPDSHDFAVRTGCNVAVTPLAKPDAEVTALMDKFNTACANNPQVPRPQIMLLRHVHVLGPGEDWRIAVGGMQDWYVHFEGLARNDQPVPRGFAPRIPDADIAARPDLALDTLRGAQVVGTPEEVIARLKAYQALGYDQFSYWIDTTLPAEAKAGALRRFIDTVLPAFA